ncbi:MAG: intradiol ring-cleavage dioxygenase [Thermomicrobiales bacterium]|nr:intradiol ring-cleavage dioxygenase [Thermomicrobiales bacterium]
MTSNQEAGRTGVEARHARTTTVANRRQILRAGASALALGALRLRFPAAAGAQEVASPVTDVCVLTPEMTEGPFYLPLDLVRRDVTEGKLGLPLQLRVVVADLANGCAPLPNAAVDIWHCDAQGFYSGVSGNPGGGASAEVGAGAEAGTFLRGIQLTGGDGMAEFLTIYPGWYSGRTVHIHMKVHVGGAQQVFEQATPASAQTYEGGHVAHTGQIFFADATSDQVYEMVAAYAGRDNARRTRNDQDGILDGHADEPGFIVALVPLEEGAPEKGFLGTITIGVDPAATPGPAGVGGPGGPSGPPPSNG